MKMDEKEKKILYRAVLKEKCPFCNADPYYDSIEIDGDKAYQTVTCSFCDKVWREIYEFIGIVEVDERNK